MQTMVDLNSLLVVDDDPLVLSAIRRVMSDLPWRLSFARSVEEAWQQLRVEVPSVILCDYRLPDGNGITLLERVHELHPRVQRILYTGEAITRTAVGVDIPVLGKPCPPEALRELFMSISEDLARQK